MKNRIYFLLPDAGVAERVVEELLLARIEHRHIHVLAKDEASLRRLPPANLLQKSDLVKAAERGAAAGGATGLLAGLVAVAFAPAGLVVAGGAVLLTTLFGTGFGVWAASLIGASLPNSELTRFEEALDRGEMLMLVDVPAGRVEEITALVQGHHPEARISTAHAPA